jgi:hypothetical protein
VACRIWSTHLKIKKQLGVNMVILNGKNHLSNQVDQFDQCSMLICEIFLFDHPTFFPEPE